MHYLESLDHLASATIKAPEPSDEEQDTKQTFEDVRTNLLD